MAALSADTTIITKGDPLIESLPLKDNVVIYKGSLVSIEGATGYAIPAADAASTYCVGIALEHVDNTVAGHAAGKVSVRVAIGPIIARLPVTGAFAQTAVGPDCFVSDSATVSAAATTNNIKVGQILARISATLAEVAITPGIRA